MKPLRIVSDQNIPAVDQVFGRFGKVIMMPGWAISPSDISDADALLVRSVTRVSEELVSNSSLRFVGSATIGTDHIDADVLRRKGIAFAHAPGSNAESVVDYVIAALVAAARERNERLRDKVIGVVGCGNVGGRLAQRLQCLASTVLRCDPPLAERTHPHPFISLDEILAASDVLTLHVPLTRAGRHPTRYLINAETLRMCKPELWLVNTSRGAVVNNAALKEALSGNEIGLAILDVWEYEPEPDPYLIKGAFLATPHIAGYSVDGKLNGTRMLFEAFCRTFGVRGSWHVEDQTDAPRFNPPNAEEFRSEEAWLDAVIRLVYDIRADDQSMRRMLDLPAASRAAFFHELRRSYPPRRDFDKCMVNAQNLTSRQQEVLGKGLGFRTR